MKKTRPTDEEKNKEDNQRGIERLRVMAMKNATESVTKKKKKRSLDQMGNMA